MRTFALACAFFAACAPLHPTPPPASKPKRTVYEFSVDDPRPETVRSAATVIEHRLRAIAATATVTVEGATLRVTIDDATTPTTPLRERLAEIVAKPGRFAMRRADSSEIELDNHDLASARAVDRHGPAVEMFFTLAGGHKLADFTTRAQGSKIEILIDGEVQSAPLVLEPITAGSALVTFAASDHARLDAEILALILDSSALPCHLRYQSAALAR